MRADLVHAAGDQPHRQQREHRRRRCRRRRAGGGEGAHEPVLRERRAPDRRDHDTLRRATLAPIDDLQRTAQLAGRARRAQRRAGAEAEVLLGDQARRELSHQPPRRCRRGRPQGRNEDAGGRRIEPGDGGHLSGAPLVKEGGAQPLDHALGRDARGLEHGDDAAPLAKHRQRRGAGQRLLGIRAALRPALPRRLQHIEPAPVEAGPDEAAGHGAERDAVRAEAPRLHAPQQLEGPRPLRAGRAGRDRGVVGGGLRLEASLHLLHEGDGRRPLPALLAGADDGVAEGDVGSEGLAPRPLEEVQGLLPPAGLPARADDLDEEHEIQPHASLARLAQELHGEVPPPGRAAAPDGGPVADGVGSQVPERHLSQQGQRPLPLVGAGAGADRAGVDDHVGVDRPPPHLRQEAQGPLPLPRALAGV